MSGQRSFDRVLHGVAATGPLLFFAVGTVLGLLQAGYDAIAMPMSALVVGPHGWVQVVNFVLLAMSFASFAVVLRKQLAPGVASLAGPALFTVMTIGVSLAGMCPMDAPGSPATLVGRLHGAAGFLVFPWMPVVLLVVARRFHRDARWRPYFGYTVATGVFCLATVVFFLLFVGPPDSPPLLASAFRGLAQRVLTLPFFVWITLVAHRASRTARTEHVAVPTSGATSRAVPV